ncbi:hypothetical protein VTN00DRAFT_9202 [Thermoascus crustaceus]
MLKRDVVLPRNTIPAIEKLVSIFTSMLAYIISDCPFEIGTTDR